MVKLDKKFHLNKSNTSYCNENLPRSIFIATEDPRKDLRDTIDNILSDKFMVLVALIMLPIILIPAIIPTLSYEMTIFFETCDILIILIFILEYTLKLYLAKDRKAHFKNGWHILDLIIILLPILVELIPFFNSAPGSTPMLLRLIRLPRAFAVGSRTMVSRLRGSDAQIEEKIEKHVIKIREIDEDLKTVHENLTIKQLQKYIDDPKQEWIDICNITEEDYVPLSKILGFAPIHIQSRLVDEAHPRIDYIENFSMVFLQNEYLKFPDKSNINLTILKTGLLVICSGSNITTISKEDSGLFDNILKQTKNRVTNKKEVVVCILYGIFDYILKTFRETVNEIESELLKLEYVPRNLVPKDFLERTFQFKKEITEFSSNLLHIKEVLDIIVSRKVPLEGFNDAWKDIFEILKDEAEYLQETIQTSKENLLSIIELFINRTSYETNKVMKVLAVITCLAVVPSMIGGLLGENLLDVPFQAYLWQVVFFTLLGMLFIVYIFKKMGWLKT